MSAPGGRQGGGSYGCAVLAPYTSVVLLSFGGPEGRAEVMPFLERVTAGRGVPPDRLAEVAEHYYQVDGVSPINAQNRALVAALAAEFARRGAPATVRLANRNSEPYVADVLAELAPGPVLVLLTSPYQSYSSCRQYREDLGRAVGELMAARGQIEVAKVPPYAGHPAFRETVTRLVVETLDTALDGHPSARVALVCVAHSIPTAADAASGPIDGGGHAYSRALQDLASELADAGSRHTGRQMSPDLAWCSRSGPPHIPWLEPDILDRLDELAETGVDTVVVAPIGFVSDHMEVVYDLDTEARERARDLGLRFFRAPTVGIDPQFVAGLVDLALARASAARGEAADELTDLPPADCPTGCCASLRPAMATVCGIEVGAHVQ